MIAEITGDYFLFLPSLFVSSLCFLLCRNWTLYHLQVASRQDSPVHQVVMDDAFLQEVTVNQVDMAPPVILTTQMSLQDVLPKLQPTSTDSSVWNPATVFPVVNEQGDFVGVMTNRDLYDEISQKQNLQLIQVGQLTSTAQICCRPEDCLTHVVEQMHEWELTGLPVVEKLPSPRIIGMIEEQHLLKAYSQWLCKKHLPV